jgi:thioredoxin 1
LLREGIQRVERAAMATIELTKDNFEDVVTKNDLVIIDFWAPWCGPCKGFAPIFTAASEKHPDVVFAKVNTDEEQELAGHFAIRSIPTVMVFREQVVLFSQAGAFPADALDNLLSQAKALDMKQVHAEIEAAQKEQGETGADADEKEAAAQPK